MRIRITAAAIAALTLTGCGASQQDAGTTAPRTTQPPTDRPRIGHTDLVLPGATKQDAQDAIRNRARTLDGYELYYLKVTHSRDAARYVCRARWYADPDAYRTHARTQDAWPDAWPHLAINCP
ncbi:hypothetical protein ACFVZZ_18795 [Streptomyces chartreusis]|uniref:hypothetical protein n=1 Tax=Streptomyces chartreusis TaxID=1969 RepID=UPI0036DA1BC0